MAGGEARWREEEGGGVRGWRRGGRGGAEGGGKRGEGDGNICCVFSNSWEGAETPDDASVTIQTEKTETGTKD